MGFDDIYKILFPKNIRDRVVGCLLMLFITNGIIYGILHELTWNRFFQYYLPISIIATFVLISWYFVYAFRRQVLCLLYFWPFPVLSIVIGVIVFYPPIWRNVRCLIYKPPDNLLVVIANFEPIPKENEKAKNYSESIAFDLWTEIKHIKERDSEVPLEAPIWYKKVIEGKSPDEKEKNAKKIGQENLAYLVVWGYVEYREGKFYLKPIITVVRPFGSIELEERQPEGMGISLAEPEVIKLTEREIEITIKKVIEETADIVSLIHGLALYVQQKYEDAINIFEGIKDPDADVCFYHGTVLISSKRFEEALKQFDKVIDKNPRYALAWNNKGVALRNSGKSEEAIACYDKAIEINPQYADAWNNKGIALAESGKHKEEVITCFDKAIDKNPQYAPAWNNKGFVLATLGKREEAIACYNKAIEIEHKLALAWNNKGTVLAEAGKRKEAIACFDKAIKINPQYADAWNNKGFVLAESGKRKEAILCWNKAVEIDPQFAEAWNNKGWTLYELGDYNKAIFCYDKAIETNLQDADAWNNKGVALYNLGKCKEAIACFDKAIGIKPQFSLVWYNKGKALENLGRFQEATEAYQNFIKYAPKDAEEVESVKELIRELQEVIEQK